MDRREVELIFADDDTLAREFEQNLKAGGAFSAGATGFTENEEVDAVLVHPTGGHKLHLAARVVWSGGDTQPGVGLAFLGFDEFLRDMLRRFVEEEDPVATPEPEPEPEAEPELEPEAEPELEPDPGPDLEPEPAGSAAVEEVPPAEVNQSLHERLRGLNTVQQRKLAAEGTPTERAALERMYGKNVWPVLLANQRITVPEVSRIARMGALPRPLLEQIAGNRTWLASAVVRRALLTNPRLGGDQLDKVLRATPRSELKLMHKQASLPRPVRERVRKLLKI